MSASGLLRERDLRAMTAVIEDGLRDDPGPAMPWAVLDRLLEIVPCEDLGFREYDLRGQQPITLQDQDVEDTRFIQCFDGKQEPPYPEYWTHRRQFLPYREVEGSD